MWLISVSSSGTLSATPRSRSVCSRAWSRWNTPSPSTTTARSTCTASSAKSRAACGSTSSSWTRTVRKHSHSVAVTGSVSGPVAMEPGWIVNERFQQRGRIKPRGVRNRRYHRWSTTSCSRYGSVTFGEKDVQLSNRSAGFYSSRQSCKICLYQPISCRSPGEQMQFHWTFSKV